MNRPHLKEIFILVIISFLTTVAAEAKPGKSCTFRDNGIQYKAESIEGFDCNPERGRETYSSHKSSNSYIPNCASPNTSYVTTDRSNNGFCPDLACERELDILIQSVCIFPEIYQ